MTPIQDKPFLLGTIKGFKIKILPFDLGEPIKMVVTLHGDGEAPIQNYDGTVIGIPLELPWQVAQTWGGDNVVIEEFVFDSCGFDPVV